MSIRKLHVCVNCIWNWHGAFSPLAFGFVLDIAGSGVHGWVFAFAALGLVSMSGPLWLRLFRTRD
jgi:hypothetical protein